LTLTEDDAPVNREGDMDAAVREGNQGELVSIGLTRKMVAANREMSNIFLHSPQNIDLIQ
jgi:hypothetical protein